MSDTETPTRKTRGRPARAAAVVSKTPTKTTPKKIPVKRGKKKVVVEIEVSDDENEQVEADVSQEEKLLHVADVDMVETTEENSSEDKLLESGDEAEKEKEKDESLEESLVLNDVDMVEENVEQEESKIEKNGVGLVENVEIELNDVVEEVATKVVAAQEVVAEVGSTENGVTEMETEEVKDTVDEKLKEKAVEQENIKTVEKPKDEEKTPDKNAEAEAVVEEKLKEHKPTEENKPTEKKPGKSEPNEDNTNDIPEEIKEKTTDKTENPEDKIDENEDKTEKPESEPEKDKKIPQNGDPEAENISDEELPGVKVAKVPEAEEVSDEELPGPKRAELPADTEDVSGDELPANKKDDEKESPKKSSKKRKASGADYDPTSPTSESETPAKKAALEKDEKDGEAKSSKPKKLPELDKYWKAVNDDPTDFTGWTYLLQYVDQENDMEAAREAYDAFLSHYPYCYGYWRKYADYEKRKGNKKKCEEVFERGLKAIPLSVDLWLHYMTYVKQNRADEEDFLRSQFERAVGACGLEFRSDRLWDSFIKWETEGRRLQKVTVLYDRLLATPTQGYTTHFDNFQEHVAANHPNKILDTDEFLSLRKEVRQILKAEAKEGEDAADAEDAEAPPGDEDSNSKATTDEETKAIKEKIVSVRRKIHKNTAAAVTARWNYEEGIKRPYFHVKPLERCQLKNWQDYLDYEIEQADKNRVIVLFERCLIACALYEEFWLKFVKYLESLKDTELHQKIRDVYERACTIHHLKKPNIHMQWAIFEECCGNPTRAAEILVNLEKQVPNVLHVAYRRINLERRRADFEKCQQLFEHYISNSKNKMISSNIAIKYSRFSFKILKDSAKAQEVLKTAITKDPNNPRLYLQLIDLILQKESVTEEEVCAVIDDFLEKESVEPEQKALFAQRKLEYLEDFGSAVQSVQAAQDQYKHFQKTIKETKKKDVKREPLGVLSDQALSSVKLISSDEEDDLFLESLGIQKKRPARQDVEAETNMENQENENIVDRHRQKLEKKKNRRLKSRAKEREKRKEPEETTVLEPFVISEQEVCSIIIKEEPQDLEEIPSMDVKVEELVKGIEEIIQTEKESAIAPLDVKVEELIQGIEEIEQTENAAVEVPPLDVKVEELIQGIEEIEQLEGLSESQGQQKDHNNHQEDFDFLTIVPGCNVELENYIKKKKKEKKRNRPGKSVRERNLREQIAEIERIQKDRETKESQIALHKQKSQDVELSTEETIQIKIEKVDSAYEKAGENQSASNLLKRLNAFQQFQTQLEERRPKQSGEEKKVEHHSRSQRKTSMTSRDSSVEIVSVEYDHSRKHKKKRKRKHKSSSSNSDCSVSIGTDKSKKHKKSHKYSKEGKLKKRKHRDLNTSGIKHDDEFLGRHKEKYSPEPVQYVRESELVRKEQERLRYEKLLWERDHYARKYREEAEKVRRVAVYEVDPAAYEEEHMTLYKKRNPPPYERDPSFEREKELLRYRKDHPSYRDRSVEGRPASAGNSQHRRQQTDARNIIEAKKSSALKPKKGNSSAEPSKVAQPNKVAKPDKASKPNKAAKPNNKEKNKQAKLNKKKSRSSNQGSAGEDNVQIKKEPLEKTLKIKKKRGAEQKRRWRRKQFRLKMEHKIKEEIIDPVEIVVGNEIEMSAEQIVGHSVKETLEASNEKKEKHLAKKPKEPKKRLDVSLEAPVAEKIVAVSAKETVEAKIKTKSDRVIEETTVKISDAKKILAASAKKTVEALVESKLKVKGDKDIEKNRGKETVESLVKAKIKAKGDKAIEKKTTKTPVAGKIVAVSAKETVGALVEAKIKAKSDEDIEKNTVKETVTAEKKLKLLKKKEKKLNEY